MRDLAGFEGAACHPRARVGVGVQHRVVLIHQPHREGGRRDRPQGGPRVVVGEDAFGEPALLGAVERADLAHAASVTRACQGFVCAVDGPLGVGQGAADQQDGAAGGEDGAQPDLRWADPVPDPQPDPAPGPA
ncbi:Uncharacterised protein [Mycobacteroides abscessus subsp. abscessus]|nr:Uncharacterised protein [Mycobacteroides abscessus subsp. abscessus]